MRVLRPGASGIGLARDGGPESANDLEQAGSACVDDPGLLEHREQIGRAGERLLAAGDDEGEQLEPLERARLGRLCRLGHLADHGQHRPLDRAADGPVGGVARRAERPRNHGLVDRIPLAEHVGEATDDLAEDDARVPARAHQSGSRELSSDSLVPVGGGLLERVNDRTDGQREVRAGVAVGNRVDVEVVDALLVRLEVAESRTGDLPGTVEVHDERLTSSIRTSTGDDREARLALHLVGDAGSHGCRDLGEVEPVFDDDVKIDLDASVARLHVDAVGEPVATGESRESPARHADDAIALGGHMTDDLRDRLGRDGDPPEIRGAREIGVLVHAARLDDARSPRVTPDACEPGRRPREVDRAFLSQQARGRASSGILRAIEESALADSRSC